MQNLQTLTPTISTTTQKRPSSINEAMFKLIIIGDSGCGKSCLMNRYVKD